MNSVDDIELYNKDLIKYCIDPSDTRNLSKIDNTELSQILPFLVRLWKNSVQTEIKNTKYKREIFKKIIQSSKTNNVFFYLHADFSEIYDDIIRTLSKR
jgi:flagellar motor switch protein FliG